MKYSQIFGKTVRDVPADARLESHKLLFKGGFVRRVSTGRWAFLPMGMRIWEKVYQVIDEEMRAIGCQKIVAPTLHPIEIWKATNRDQAFGEEMLVVDDHHGARFAIGATAEGLMVELVKMLNPTYKDLPILIYQFTQKFRDDKRPRGGIMRVREFMMKDAYSFCETEKQALEVYQKFYDAYLKIAKRLDLPVTPVLADSGAIGGSLSHEFQLESLAGDQTYFICDQCGYGANVEKAVFLKEEKNSNEEERPLKEVDAKRGNTMEDGVKLHGLPLWQQIKDVMFIDETGRFILTIIRGDFNVNEIKLKNVAGINELRHATDEEIKEKLHSWPGFISPAGIKDNLAVGVNLIIVADESLKSVKNAYGGSNKQYQDLQNMNYGRDYAADIVADVAEVAEGYLCAQCKKSLPAGRQGKLQKKIGFEWGHCFKQDHFYTKPQNGYFTDKKGEKKLLWMGAYGIGIERTVACIVEAHHDEKGIIWPESIAPFAAHLIVIGETKNVIRNAAKAYEQLEAAGIETLYDDRSDVSAGEKFADADLIGCPVRLVVSEKTLRPGSGQASNKVEWKNRDSQKTELLELGKVIKRLADE